MIKDISTDEKLRLVRDGLTEKMPSLEEFGYVSTGESSFTTKLTGTSYNFTYNSSSIDRRIDFDFTAKDVLPSDGLGVFIASQIKKDRFSLDDYFTAHKQKDKAYHVGAPRRETEEFSAWLDEKLKLIDSIFANELRDILTGKRWERVPMDWHGYK